MLRSLCRIIKKSRAFYVDLLGFEVIRENYREDRGDYKLDLKLGDMELEIFGIKDAPKKTELPRSLWFEALSIQSGTYRRNSRLELQGLGIETEPVRIDTFTGEKNDFLFDPDGLPLELHE